MTAATLRGGGGAGGGGFVSRPDSLRSQDQFELLLGLGSGRWKGLTKGLKSALINDIPIEDDAGVANFKDMTFVFADGDPTQTQIVTFNLGAGASYSAVGGGSGTQLANTNVGAPGSWVNAAVTVPGVDHIDLRFLVQQLFNQTEKGVFETTASIEIEMKPSGYSNWINVYENAPAVTYDPKGISFALRNGGSFGEVAARMLAPSEWFAPGGYFNEPDSGSFQITGKTTSAYVREIRISVPNSGAYANRTWQIRCRLVEKDTLDEDKNQQRRQITWESVGASIGKKWGDGEEWRGLVWGQLYGNASDQLTGVPKFAGVFDTLVCPVPPAVVFDPETRIYSGATWDGSYDYQYTNDPAWCLKAIIEDPISGIAALSPGSTLNKWDALEASKMFSEQVPDGAGGTQPRFSMNLSIEDPRAAEDLIQYIAGAVNGLAWEEDPGKWRLTVSKLRNPVAVFVPENIVGDFGYSHTDMDTRANDVTMTFLNEENNFAQDQVRVFDQDDIDNRGRVPISLVAVGCNLRQEALRRAQFRLSTSLNETQMVSFATNRQGLMVSRFDTILIADPDFGDVQTTGRLLTMSGGTVTCRDPVRLEVGVAYELKLTIPNPDYVNPDLATAPSSADWRSPTITIARTIVNNSSQRGDVTTLYLNAALPARTPINPAFALAAVGLPATPVAYQVIDIERVEGSELVNITALNIYAAKYAEMDAVVEGAFSARPPSQAPLPPGEPADGMISLRLLRGEAVMRSVMQVAWQRPAGQYIQGFKVEQSLNNGPRTVLYDSTPDTSFDISDPQIGLYNFWIYTVDRSGNISLPITDEIEILEAGLRRGVGTLAARPSTLQLVGDRYTTTDQSPNLTSIWDGTTWFVESSKVATPGDLGVDGNATFGDNLIPNARFAENGLKWFSPGGAYSRAPCVAGGPSGFAYQTTTGNESSFYPAGFVPVFGGKKLYGSAWLYSAFATTILFGLQEYDAAGAVINTFSEPVSIPAGWTLVPRTYQLNAATVNVFPLYYFGPYAGGTISQMAEPRLSYSQPGADVTAAQPIVSKLSPATGNALDNFLASDGIPFSRVVARGEARDGDAVSFPATYSSVPQVSFSYGGNAATAGQNIKIQADALTASGFTMRAKSQAVTVGSTTTDTGSSAGSGPEPARVMNRSNGGVPFDGRFVFTYPVTVGNIAPGEPGTITVGIYCKIGGSWIQVGSADHGASGTYSVAVTPGTVDFGAGNEFGVGATYTEGSGTAVTGFTSVVYQLGTTTETSLTPSGASPIKWEARL